jgi:transcriptional regulator with XRE-family HTH domain
MARGINLTPDQIAEIRKLKKAGKLTTQEIGDRFGVTRSIISKHTSDIKSNPEVSSRKTSKAKISKIRGLKLQGVTLKAIAKRVGVSPETVTRHTRDIKGNIGAANRKYPSQDVADWHNEKYGTNLEADDIGRSHRTKYSRASPTGRATSAAHSANRRATILAATPLEATFPAFKAEIDSLFKLAELIPGKFEVDHIKRLIDGGLHHPDNLQLLKYEAHRLKTALENAGKFEAAKRVGAFNEYSLEPKLRSLLAENVKSPGLMNFFKRGLKQGGFVNPRVAGSLALGSAATLGFMSLLSPGGREAAEAGIEKVKTVGESVLRNNPKIMETLALLGVPQEKMFETIYNLQGQGEWKGDRRIDAGDIVQNAMGQDWMARNPRLYAGISTLSDFGIDPLVGLGKVGGLLKSGVSELRKLRNIWD